MELEQRRNKLRILLVSIEVSIQIKVWNIIFPGKRRKNGLFLKHSVPVQAREIKFKNCLARLSRKMELDSIVADGNEGKIMKKVDYLPSFYDNYIVSL